HVYCEHAGVEVAVNDLKEVLVLRIPRGDDLERDYVAVRGGDDERLRDRAAVEAPAASANQWHQALSYCASKKQSAAPAVGVGAVEELQSTQPERNQRPGIQFTPSTSPAGALNTRSAVAPAP